MSGPILGIWDGHDAGAALVQDGNVLAAINEERLSRRKLDVGFPVRSLAACLNQAGLKPPDIAHIAVSTSDFSKTLTRVFPSLKEEYYLIRRRKKSPGGFTALKKRVKYRLTELGPSGITGFFSRRNIQNHLRECGFGPGAPITFIDHHLCHAATAAFFSHRDPCLVITIDGIGDALSGSVSAFQNGTLKRLAGLSGTHSLGIFFEHITNLMNMRELEDEGKVMALANYAYPIPDEENPLLDLVRVEGMQVRCRYGSLRMFDELKKILWRYPPEQFAYMAQRTLENRVCELVQNCVASTGVRNVAAAGGVFSNIKMNMRLRLLPEVDACVVFPHMGDGGLALGAAAALNYQHNNVTGYATDGIYWGPSYSEEDMLAAVQTKGLQFRRLENVAAETAQIIADDGIVFWLQDAMEYGPRALGRRSILARPDSTRIKDLLNLRLKMRVWYQPFCPSMLAEEGERVLENCDGLQNRFMTMGYMVKPGHRDAMAGVTGIDGSCRPQFVIPQDGLYHDLLQEVRKRTGSGIVLNTSFNVHGDPLVCSPDDAVETLLKTGNEYLVMGNLLVEMK